MSNFKTSTREALMVYLANSYKDVTELLEGSEVYHQNIHTNIQAAAMLLQEALAIVLDVKSEDVLSQFRSADGDSYIGHIG